MRRCSPAIIGIGCSLSRRQQAIHGRAMLLAGLSEAKVSVENFGKLTFIPLISCLQRQDITGFDVRIRDRVHLGSSLLSTPNPQPARSITATAQ